MADYDWFTKEPATDSDEKVWGVENDYAVHQGDPQQGNLNKYKRKLYASVVWCDFCQCSIRPQLVYMRQHRRVCADDPRVAGDSSESIKDLINGIYNQ